MPGVFRGDGGGDKGVLAAARLAGVRHGREGGLEYIYFRTEFSHF